MGAFGVFNIDGHHVTSGKLRPRKDVTIRLAVQGQAAEPEIRIENLGEVVRASGQARRPRPRRPRPAVAGCVSASATMCAAAFPGGNGVECYLERVGRAFRRRSKEPSL